MKQYASFTEIKQQIIDALDAAKLTDKEIKVDPGWDLKKFPRMAYPKFFFRRHRFSEHTLFHVRIIWPPDLNGDQEVTEKIWSRSSAIAHCVGAIKTINADHWIQNN